MTKSIIDGYVFQNEGSLYNLFPESYSGDILKRVEPGDILYSFYDLDAADSAKANCLHRITEWEDDFGGSVFEDAEILYGLSPVSVLQLMEEGIIEEMHLVIEASYLC